MSRNIEEIKKYYAELDNDILQNIASTEMDELDAEVQDVVVEEMQKRGLEVAAPPAEIKLNEAKLNEYIAVQKLEQNLPLAFIGGLVAAIIGAVLWAVITVATGYQIGYMAIAVGFIVGFVIRFLGKGFDGIFGIMGAVLALFGCLLGNVFSMVGFAAESEGLGYVEILSMLDLSLIPQLLIETFSPIDLLFYGFAIYQAYNMSFRQLTEEEIIEHATDK